MDNERYSLEKAQEEALELQKKVESGEASDYIEAEEKLGKKETELTPEVIEDIMEKVQDIDADGVAFSALSEMGKLPINFDGEIKFRSILKEGLLGSRRHGDEARGWDAKTSISKERWVRNVRFGKPSIIWFNIVGRIKDINLWGREEAKYVYGQRGSIRMVRQTRYRGLRVIFDISSFKEQMPQRTYDMKYGKPSDKINKTFRADRDGVSDFDENIEDPIAKIKPDEEFGFMLTHRVASRYFKGLVVTAYRKLTEEEKAKNAEMYLETQKSYLIENGGTMSRQKILDNYYRNLMGEGDTLMTLDENALQATAKKVASVMLEVYSSSPDKLLPIYDENGNLLWPRKMSHEEVKEFVAEREH